MTSVCILGCWFGLHGDTEGTVPVVALEVGQGRGEELGGNQRQC